jgi:hypothetical protein
MPHASRYATHLGSEYETQDVSHAGAQAGAHTGAHGV